MIEENGETPKPCRKKKKCPFTEMRSKKSAGCCDESRQDFRIHGEDNVELERCPPANEQLIESTVIVCLTTEKLLCFG